MFNKSFNLPQFISDLPSLELRSHVLRAVVGSINASLVGAATTAVRGLLADGYDISRFDSEDGIEKCGIDGLSVDEIKDSIRGSDTGVQHPDDFITENKALYAFGVVLREKLERAEGRTDAGSIANTLAFMTGPQNARNVDTSALDALKSVGIVFTDEELKSARDAQRATDQARADQRAKIVGPIEWFLDNVFACDPDDIVGKNDDDIELGAYLLLTEQRQEMLCGKTLAALNTAIQRAKQNTLFGGKGLGVSDILFATKAIAAMAEGIVAVRAPAKPAEGPTPGKAKRVRKPAAAKPASVEKLQALVEHAAH